MLYTHILSSHSQLPTPPPVPATTNMLLWIYLSWIFRIKGIIQSVTFVSGFFHLDTCASFSPMEACVSTYSFSRLNHISLHIHCMFVSIYHSLFIHLSTGGHSACFHVFAVVNKAALNIRVKYLFSCFQFFWLYA